MRGLVANSHPWHAEHLVRTCPVFEFFDAVTLSFEVKSLVPDHRILNDPLGQLGLMSEQCLLLTSQADHVQVAERQCLHGPDERDVEPAPPHGRRVLEIEAAAPFAPHFAEGRV